MEQHYDIAIIGGGMAGLAMAVALARHNLQIAVVEKSDLKSLVLPEFDGRVCALSLGSQTILDNIGVWAEMDAHAQPILDIRVHEQGGFGHVHYDHRDVGDAPMGYIIENRFTRLALQKAAATYKNITIFAPHQLQQQRREAGQVQLQLDDGRELRARLLIAADGRFSKLREWAGIGDVRHDYKQTAIVATIRHSEPHQGLALERFFADGPFAVLPMRGNLSSLVWAEPTATARALLALPQSEVLEYLNSKMQGYLGELSFETPLWSYPLIAVMSETYIADRFLLLGDAAHGIHPIAGQGLNLGIRDIGVLEEVIAEALAAGEDIGSRTVLARYEKWRRFDAMTMFAATDGINMLFSNDIWPLSLARNTGFALVNRWPGVRNFFMRHAMGVVGDLPKLAKSVSAK